MLWVTVPVVLDVVVAATPCDGVRRDAWDRARAPELSRYCDLLSQAEASLEGDPKRAAGAATEADRLVKGRSAPLVLLARAASAEERAADAVDLFARARAIDARAGDDAESLLALAASLTRTNDAKGALAAYRALVPKASALGVARRTRARIDAGLAILGDGPNAVAEAVSVLRAAEAGATPEIAALADAALALALDRQGARAEAKALAASAAAAGAIGVVEGTTGRLTRREDALALVALLREGTDAPRAAAAWDAFIAGAASSPWVAHARARAVELRRGSRTGGGRK